jgi:hypothetical protein
VPARPDQRDGTRPGPLEEHLYPRGQTPSLAGADGTAAADPGEVIGYLREHEITLTWNPASAALQARGTETAKTVTIKAG